MLLSLVIYGKCHTHTRAQITVNYKLALTFAGITTFTRDGAAFKPNMLVVLILVLTEVWVL